MMRQNVAKTNDNLALRNGKGNIIKKCDDLSHSIC